MRTFRLRQCSRVALVVAVGAVALAGCSGAGPAPGSTTSAATGTGDFAEWRLVDPAKVTPDTTTLQLEVSRAGCADGVTGQVLAPQVTVQARRIIIQVDVAPLPGGAYSCQSNDWVPLTVELSEPVGDRELFDALCLDSVRLTHSYCVDGGVRWRP
ncbi:hypothetical protein [Arthrobacter sp. HY1533]|uniref:hypothetical protein n=1 Tax=Arthrobacter sp. HY1533 TaxID=2970919 RepID=UPI0022B9E3A5|nr:hypothetical protein [Arthrobacter sp. HY1533]